MQHTNSFTIAARFNNVHDLRHYINRVWRLGKRASTRALALMDLAIDLEIILIDRLHDDNNHNPTEAQALQTQTPAASINSSSHSIHIGQHRKDRRAKNAAAPKSTSIAATQT